jgi:hypothetical protein
MLYGNRIFSSSYISHFPETRFASPSICNAKHLHLLAPCRTALIAQRKHHHTRLITTSHQPDPPQVPRTITAEPPRSQGQRQGLTIGESCSGLHKTSSPHSKSTSLHPNSSFADTCLCFESSGSRRRDAVGVFEMRRRRRRVIRIMWLLREREMDCTSKQRKTTIAS